MPKNNYKHTPLNQSFYFKAGDGHELNVELCGNPHGIPVVFLHGGPGSCINEKCRWFFDPKKYYIVLFDQRGTGKSKPFLSLENNTTFSNAGDMESLRIHLGIKKWIIFGGSYGSTLGLLYATLHPQQTIHLVLRGIFLGRKEDVDWLFQEGAGNFYPEEFNKFRSFIQPDRQNDLVNAYYEIMTGKNEAKKKEACKHWSDWENGLLRIKNGPLNPEIQLTDLSGALLEAHYFVNKMFWNDDNFLIKHINGLAKIPIDIFHGRFDIDCRLKGAYDLKIACPHADLHIVQEGSHYPYDSPMFDLLVDKMDELADRYAKN